MDREKVRDYLYETIKEIGSGVPIGGRELCTLYNKRAGMQTLDKLKLLHAIRLVSPKYKAFRSWSSMGMPEYVFIKREKDVKSK